MKRILLSLIAILCISMGYAQNKFNLSEVKSLTNYGIDFTIAKVYGSSPEEQPADQIFNLVKRHI